MTGYFTSRPSLKRHVKYADNLLQSAKQLNILSHPKQDKDLMENIIPLQESLGILQHHDGVSGTCKQFVNNDYVRMLSESIGKVEQSIIDSLKALTTSGQDISQTQIFCHQLNISECSITEKMNVGSNLIMSVYNPLAHPINHFIRIPVEDGEYKVTNASGRFVSTQVGLIH